MKRHNLQHQVLSEVSPLVTSVRKLKVDRSVKSYQRMIGAYDPGDTWFFSDNIDDWHGPVNKTLRRQNKKRTTTNGVKPG